MPIGQLGNGTRTRAVLGKLMTRVALGLRYMCPADVGRIGILHGLYSKYHYLRVSSHWYMDIRGRHCIGAACVLIGLFVVVSLVAPQFVIGGIEYLRVFVLSDSEFETELSWKDGPDFIYDCPRDEFDHVLGRHGFTPNPAAYLVYVEEEGTNVYGSSWGYREHPLSSYQTHVTVVDVKGQTYVYAHREWSVYRHPVKHTRNPGGPDVTPDGVSVVESVLGTTPNDGGSATGLEPYIRDMMAATTSCSRIG